MTYTWIIHKPESANPGSSTDAPKLERVFRMINLLASGRCTIRDIADRLEVDDRTVYRYLSLIETCGFKVEKQWRYYKLNRSVYPDFVKALK